MSHICDIYIYQNTPICKPSIQITPWTPGLCIFLPDIFTHSEPPRIFFFLCPCISLSGIAIIQMFRPKTLKLCLSLCSLLTSRCLSSFQSVLLMKMRSADFRLSYSPPCCPRPLSSLPWTIVMALFLLLPLSDLFVIEESEECCRHLNHMRSAFCFQCSNGFPLQLKWNSPPFKPVDLSSITLYPSSLAPGPWRKSWAPE